MRSESYWKRTYDSNAEFDTSAVLLGFGGFIMVCAMYSQWAAGARTGFNFREKPLIGDVLTLGTRRRG